MNRTPTALADTRMGLDTLLRRELKVGDPNDPTQLARALMERYQGDRRAQAIDSEAKGLPFLQAPLLRALDQPAPAALQLDLELARSRVRDDLQGLLTDSLTQTLRPELEGWQEAITRTLDEGVASARVGLDPGRRDVAFAARRQLNEYARLSRLVGLFSPSLRAQYRSLAGSLDDAATVILIMIGDAMANLGLSGGRFLLKTPYAELQARRDAVLNALRRIDGISVLATDTGHWPRGLRAHRQMNLLLEAGGQGELRSLLSEPELARTMDEMVQLASGGTPHGLRSIGSTAWSALSRLRRFVRSVGGLVDPASHELAGLVESLRLFIEGFEPAGGFRLLRVARPALLGQTGGGLVDEQPADRRLVALTQLRPAFADQVDAWLGCRCELPALQVQAALDRVLFDLDRAIDAYANGSTELGLCEVRATAMHVGLQALWSDTTRIGAVSFVLWPAQPQAQAPGWVQLLRQPAAAGLQTQLITMTGLLRPTAAGTPLLWRAGTLAAFDAAYDENRELAGEGAPAPRFGRVLHDEVANGLDADRQWSAVIRQMAADGSLITDVMDAPDGLLAWQDAALSTIERIAGVPAQDPAPQSDMPLHFETALTRLVS